MDLAPIAFFAYNRPGHTRRALESLAANEGASESELFIFCDGLKRPEDSKAVEDVRKLVKSRKWCGTVSIIERDKNLGLADSIISGVTELCNRYGRVIVLEDDLVLSPQFLNFMNDALGIYNDIERVMHISGYMFPVKGRLPETFFYRATSCWGWATWKRAWDNFEPDAKKLLSELDNKGLQYEFDIKGSMSYYKMLKNQADRKIDSWAVRWYASVFLCGGLCLHPGESFVNNIGHDGTGVHCSSTDSFNVKLSNIRVSDFTKEINESGLIVDQIATFNKAINNPPITTKIWHIFKKAKDLLKNQNQ